MALTPEKIERIQKLKAEIITETVYPKIAEDDTSAEIQEMVEELTTDQTVVEMVMELIELKEGVDMNDDPGIQEAEIISQAEEDAYYGDLADSQDGN